MLLRDPDGATNRQTFTLTVVSRNDAPTLNPITGITLNEGAGPQSITLTGIGTGAPNESQPLALSALSSNPALIPHPTIAYTHLQSTGLLTFVLAPGAHGSALVSVTVHDHDATNHTVTRDFTITVNPVDDPPAITFIPPRSTPEDTPLVVPFNVTDDLSAASALTVMAAVSDTNLVPTASLTLGGAGSSRTLSLLPATNRSGTATIMLTVRDTNNLSSNRAFLLTVDPVNDPPVLSDVPNQSVAEDTNGLLVAFTVSDPETIASNLLVTARSSNALLVPDASLILASSAGGTNRSLTLRPLSNATGTATITLTVRDPNGLVATDTFLLTVNAQNDPPFLSNVPDAAMEQDSVLGLAFAVGDSETSASNLVVTVASSDTNLIALPGLALGGAGPSRTLTLSPQPGRTGSAIITLSVSDGNGGTAQDTFTVTVQPIPPLPPLITSSPSSLAVAVGSNAAFTVVATGTAPLAYQWRFNGTNLVGATNATLTIFNAQVADAGNYLVVVTNHAGSVTSTVASLSVLPPSQPPAIAGLTTNLSLNEDSLLTRPFTVSDPDTPLFRLVLGATSSNTTLVPITNIFFDGSGSNRLLIVAPATNTFGTTLLSITVSDGAAIRTNSFVLTVNAVNDPPTLAPLNDVLIDGGGNPALQTIPLAAIASGAANESQTLVVSASSANTSLVPNPSVSYSSPTATGSIAFDSAGNNVSGNSLITVTVNDGAASNNLVSRSFTAYYYRNNTPPTITPLGNQSLNEDAASGPLPFTIGDGTTPLASLALRAFSSNPGLLPTNNIVFGGSGANRTITLTPLPEQSGTASVRVAVYDTDNAFAATTFNVTVDPINDLPAISPLSNQSINQNAPTSILPFLVSDRETPADRLLVTAGSSDTALVPLSSILLGGHGTNRALQILPATNRSGVATITLTVTDANGGSTATNFTLTVVGTNDPPSISALTHVAFDEDSPGGPIAFVIDDDLTAPASLSLAAASTNAALLPPANISFGGSGANRTVTLSPVPNQSGQTLVTLTVTDGGGMSASRSFVVVVRPVNDPPTLNPLPDLTLPLGAPPRIVTFTGAGPGVANENQFLVVTATSANPAVLPDPLVTYSSPAASGSLTLVPRAIGTSTVAVLINDGGPVNPATLRAFTVIVTGPPTLAGIADQSTDEDAPLAPITFSVADAETAPANLTLAVSASNTNLLPAGSLVLGEAGGANRSLTLLPATNQFGNATVTVTLTDADTNLVSQSFSLLVRPVNDPPTLNPPANRTLPEDAPEQTVNLTGISSGATNEIQALFVTATSSRPDLIPHPTVNYTSPAATGTLTFIPLTNATGTATVSVVVFDGQSLNGSVTQSFTITVTASNDLPTISSIANLSTNEDHTALVGFVVGDLETDPGALTLSATSSDTNLVPRTGITFDGTNASRLAWITPAPNQSGTATVAITVTDSHGGSNTTSFTLTIHPVNDPPSIVAPMDLTTTEDTAPAALAFTLGDVETAASALSVRALSSNPTLLPTNAIVLGGTGTNRTLSLTPAPNQSGSALVTLVVTDTAGAESTASFTLGVTPANDPPSISDLLNLTTEQDSPTAIVPFTVSDVETPAASLNVSASSSDPALVPIANISLDGSGSNRTVRVHPARHRFGTVVITLTVTDGSGASTSDAFTLTILEILEPPVIVTGPLGTNVTAGATVTFSVSAVGSAPLAYQWMRNGMDLPGATDRTLTLANAQAADAGSYRVRVSNPAGSATSAAAILEVVVAPIITSISRTANTTHISFSTQSGSTCTVEYRDQAGPGPWSSLPSVPGTGGIITVPDPDVIVPRRIYRVREDF